MTELTIFVNGSNQSLRVKSFALANLPLLRELRIKLEIIDSENQNLPLAPSAMSSNDVLPDLDSIFSFFERLYFIGPCRKEARMWRLQSWT